MNAQPGNDESLTAIRGLVARGEIYRAVFARVALVSGVLSIVTAVGIYLNDEVSLFLGRAVRPREFAFAWLDVFFLSAIATLFLLRRAERNPADDFPSTRLKLVLSAIAPCFLIPAVFTVWFFATGYLGAAELELAIIWTASYGLMLLSTSLFAPRAIVLLGWAFLLSAIATPILADRIDDWTGNASVALLGVSFGLFHIVYAALNWGTRRGVAAEPI